MCQRLAYWRAGVCCRDSDTSQYGEINIWCIGVFYYYGVCMVRSWYNTVPYHTCESRYHMVWYHNLFVPTQLTQIFENMQKISQKGILTGVCKTAERKEKKLETKNSEHW